MTEENNVVKSVGEMIKEGSMNPRDIHSEWENNKDALIAQLQEGIVEVTFLKVNGDERVMTCTLREDVKPAATKKDPLTLEKVRKINEEVLSVWDVKAEGWRSFRWGLISSVTESDVVIDVETA